MKQRKVITCCATTDHGGLVLQGYPFMSHKGHCVASKGHLVWCPQCNGIFPIVESTKSFLAIAPALEGMRTACGARLIGLFDDYLMDDDSGISDLDVPKQAMAEAIGSATSPIHAAGTVSSNAFEVARAPEPVHVVIRIVLCNDGTGNNFANSKAALAKCSPEAADLDKHPGVIDQLMAACRKQQKVDGDSYTGGETNVHRLHDLYQVTEKIDKATHKSGRLYVYRRAYIEGIGTRAEHKDSVYGFAMGYGPTGVIARAKEAINAAVKEIQLFMAMNPTAHIIIDAIEVDLFGFSRGSAASRHVLHLITHGGDTSVMAQALHNAGLPLKSGWNGGNKSDLRVCFVGLFESVAAMGIPNNDANDPAKLYIADNDADVVVQLVAGDECRENFALNRVLPGKHVEITVPGVHSDVGGGYPMIGWEQGILTRPEVSIEPLDYDEYLQHANDTESTGHARFLRDYLQGIASRSKAHQRAFAQISETWPALSRPGLIDPQLNPPPNDNNYRIQTWYTVIGNPDQRQRGRGQPYALQVTAALVVLRQVRGEYQLITLRIMHALAKRAGVPLKDIPNEPKYALPDELKPICDKLVAYALSDGKGDYPLTADEQQLLSRRYLHQSANWNPLSWKPIYEEQPAGPTQADLPKAQAGPGIVFPLRPADQRKRLIYKQKKGH